MAISISQHHCWLFGVVHYAVKARLVTHGIRTHGGWVGGLLDPIVIALNPNHQLIEYYLRPARPGYVLYVYQRISSYQGNAR